MKCYLCHRTELEEIVEPCDIRFNCYGYHKHIYKCGYCGLVQLLPQWSEAEQTEIYKNYNEQKDFANQKVMSYRVSPYLLKYITPTDMVLEIGCGKGDNLAMLAKNDICAEGIDRDPCTRGIRPDIHNIDYKLFKPQHKYNVVYGIQLFEHLEDPIKFIRLILDEYLEHDGTLLLEFPNVDDPLLTLYNIPKFKRFYYRPDHLFFYNYNTLVQLMWQVGCYFEIELVQNYGLVNHLNWLFTGKPTNLKIDLGIIDKLYKWILINKFKRSDTLLLKIQKGEK